MRWALKLIGRPAAGPSQHDGRYVVAYDPTVVDGTIQLETAADIRHAKIFASPEAALAYYRAVSPNVPLDPGWSGKPNRPLTAFTVELVPFR